MSIRVGAFLLLTDGISLEAGETKEFTHIFNESGETLAGCHVVGHYAGGMKAMITVTG